MAENTRLNRRASVYACRRRGDTTIDQDDYNVWRANFGNHAPTDSNESFSVQPNVGIIVNAANGLLVGAADPDAGDNVSLAAASVGTFATTAGGSITVAADGSFTYNPQAGDKSLNDSFTYTVRDATGATDTSTATFNLNSNIIWFVDLSAVGGGDGTVANPFNSLAPLDNGGPDANNDTIFVYRTTPGAATTDLGAEDFDLQSGQFLIGEGVSGGAGDDINDVRGFTTQAFSRTLPLINGEQHTIVANGDAITLNTGNTIRGLDIGATGSGTKIIGASVGTLVIDDVGLSGPGGALNLANGAIQGLTGGSTAVFNNLSSSSSTNAISLTGMGGSLSGPAASSLAGATGATILISAGTVSFTYSGNVTQANNAALLEVNGGHTTGTITFNTGTLSATNGTGLQFDNADSTTSYNFNGTTTLNGGDAGIDILNGSAGTFTFGAGTSITSPTGIAFNIDGGATTSTVNVTYSGSITQANNFAMVNVNNHNTGTITFQTGTLSATSGTGLQFSNADSTTSYNFNGTTTLNGGDAGIDITGGSGGTFTFGANTSINNPSGVAYREDTTTANVTFNGTIAKTNNANNAVHINAKTGGATTFNGQINASTTTATAVDLTSNTGGTINFNAGGNGLDITTTSGTGFNATGGGTVTVQGSGNSISTSTGRIINADGISVGASGIAFATLGSTGVVAADAISLNNVDGGGTFNGGAVTIADTSGATSDGIAITGGSAATFTFASATIDNTDAHGINLNGANGAVTFTTVDIDGMTGTNDGINVTGNTNAVNVNGGSIGSADDPANNAVEVNGGNGSVTIAAALTKTTGGKIVNITGRTGGTITLSGNLSATGGVDNGIDVNNNSGGTVNFSGATKTINTGAATAVNLATNTGATINFTGGGLDIDTTTGTGFSASGGGAISVQGTGNSVNSVSATALNVANTTIGASGLTFQRIDSGNNTAAADPASGIVLNNTGSSGGLTVTGTGTAGTGGTIQNTTGTAILLTTTFSPSFDRMNIQNTGGSGVRGTTAVTNFTFTNGTINNSGTGGGNQESSIAFNDPTGSATDAKVTGTVTVTGNTLTNALWHGVSILQFAGTLADVNISNNVITSGTTTGTGGNSFGSGIQLFAGGVAATVASVTRAELNGNTITNFPGGVLMAIQGGTSNGTGPTGNFGIPGSATNDIEIKNNILNGGGTTPDGVGGFIKPNQIILVTVNGRGQGQFTIQNNGTVADPLSGSAGNIIDISAGGAVTVQATVSGNQIDCAGQSVSGTSGIAAGVGPFTVTGPTVLSTSTLYATVQSNSIKNSAGSGIRLNVNAGDPTLNAIVTNNTVTAPISATYGIQVVEGNNAGFTGNVNLQIANNTSTGGTGGGNTFPGIGLRKFSAASGEFAIVGLSPSPATNAQMESNVAGQNPASASGTFGTGGVAAVNGSSNNWTSVASVPQPPALPLAATGMGAGPVAILTDSELSDIAAAAINRLATAGASASQLALLESINFQIVDFDGAQLGSAGAGIVQIDINGAGWGYYVDDSPYDDSEFNLLLADGGLAASENSAAYGRIDLLSVVMHEFGHILGHDHDEGGVMSETLETGVRHADVDALFADHDALATLFS